MKISTILMALAILVSGCTVASHHGQLVLTISTDTQSLTLEPSLDTTIASYRITGSGPDGESFQRDGVTGSTLTVDALAVGTWQVGVEAYNGEGTLIGYGSDAVDILAGQTTVATITVSPLDGEGVLEVTVSWTAGLLADPTVAGTLQPLGGTAWDLAFTLGTDAATSTNPGLEAGYYTLTLALYEGDSLVWGTAEAVRILAGQVTTGSFTLTSEDIDPGSLSLTISPDMQDPFQVGFQGGKSELAPGADMTVVSWLDPPQPSPSYRWYLDGSVVDGETGDSITVGGGLEEGVYRLDLVVESGGVLSSSGFGFVVSAYARTPVLFVHGYEMSSTTFNTLVGYLEQEGYPPILLRAIDLVPDDGSNITAAEQQIAPAVEQLLDDVNQYLADNKPALAPKARVDLVSHSMGGLSTRWYASQVTGGAQRVRSWVSLAGANHGSSIEEFADESTEGEQEMYPAFAESEAESLVQYTLNGAPYDPDVDETPYGLGTD
ncbi:MAG: esterase/lipase family protein, partial [Spirochaetota bacterium]